MAIIHLAGPDGMRMLSIAVQDLVDGQSADIAFERRAAELVALARLATQRPLGGS
jgi:hypothetical protein